MENLGSLAILLAFCLSVFAIVAGAVGGWRRNAFLVHAAGRAVYSVCFLLTVAASVLVIDMFVAFLMVHKTALTGPQSGELAFVYLAGYVMLVIAGGGLFSLDTIAFAGTGRSRIQKRG